MSMQGRIGGVLRGSLAIQMQQLPLVLGGMVGFYFYDRTRRLAALPGEPRYFNATTKGGCWDKGALVPGRDPSRWRADPIGNILFYPLHASRGPVGYEYDHIKAYADGGSSKLKNCQIMQTPANRAKSNGPFNVTFLKNKSYNIVLTAHMMDIIEMCAYGDIFDYKNGENVLRCKVYKNEDLKGLPLFQNYVPPCLKLQQLLMDGMKSILQDDFNNFINTKGKGKGKGKNSKNQKWVLNIPDEVLTSFVEWFETLEFDEPVVLDQQTDGRKALTN